MFSRTFIESKSAPPWNSIATFLRTGISSSSSYPAISSPSTITRPRSGRWRPMMCRIRTDLPLPLPPRTTMVSPLRMSKVIPSSTLLAPNALCTFSNLTNASSIAARPEGEEELRQEEVRDQDTEGRGHDGLGGGAPDAIRPARRGQAVVAAHEPEKQGEEGRFPQAAQDVVEIERRGDV